MHYHINKSFVMFFILALVFVINYAAERDITNFTLKDFNGVEHTLTDYADSKAIVVMFIATNCPVSNDYNSRMVELNKNYSDKGISFIGINSNKAENIENIKEHSEENNFEFVVLKDVNNVVADQFEAKHTPEIFVLNGSLDLLYHGRIDDSRDPNKVETKDLEIALNSIIKGEAVAVPETKAFGCSIKRVDK